MTPTERQELDEMASKVQQRENNILSILILIGVTALSFGAIVAVGA